MCIGRVRRLCSLWLLYCILGKLRSWHLGEVFRFLCKLVGRSLFCQHRLSRMDHSIGRYLLWSKLDWLRIGLGGIECTLLLLGLHFLEYSRRTRRSYHLSVISLFDRRHLVHRLCRLLVVLSKGRMARSYRPEGALSLLGR